MVIAVDIREWQPGRRTGIGRVLEEFLRVATGKRPRDRFLLLGNSSTEVRVRGDNVQVIAACEYWTPWWDQVTLPKLLFRHGADVLYSPYIKVPLCAPVPVLSTIHDLSFFVRPDYPVTWSDPWLNPPFRVFCHLVVRRASAVLVDSVTSANDVRHALGTASDKLRIVPLASSPTFTTTAASQTDDAIRRRYGLSAGYVLYVGAFWRHKNVVRLVKAYAALPASMQARHPLVLVGGPMTDELGAVLRSLGNERIQYVGLVDDGDLPAFYRGALLFAFPSHYEGFGLPVLEAMACGIPVLCSTAPALVELTGEAAVHTDPGDEAAWQRTLHALIADSERRKLAAASGLVRAAAFSAERMAGEILQVIDEVVSRQKQARLAHGDI